MYAEKRKELSSPRNSRENSLPLSIKADIEVTDHKPRQRVKIIKDANGKEQIVHIKPKKSRSLEVRRKFTVLLIYDKKVLTYLLGEITPEKAESYTYQPPKERYPEDDGIEFVPYSEEFRNSTRRILYSSLGKGIEIGK